MFIEQKILTKPLFFRVSLFLCGNSVQVDKSRRTTSICDSWDTATKEYPKLFPIQCWTCQQHLLGTCSKADALRKLQAHIHMHCTVSTTHCKSGMPCSSAQLPGKPQLGTRRADHGPYDTHTCTFPHLHCLLQHQSLYLLSGNLFPGRNLYPVGNAGVNILCPAVI